MAFTRTVQLDAPLETVFAWFRNPAIGSTPMLARFEGTWTYTVEPDGSGTRLTYHNESASFWRIPPLSWLPGWATARTHEPVMAELQASLATH